jgi:hypothetical protein
MRSMPTAPEASARSSEALSPTASTMVSVRVPPPGAATSMV